MTSESTARGSKTDYFIPININLFDFDLIASFDILDEALFLFGYEHDSSTLGTCTSGSSDTVDVGFWIFWHVVVDHEFDVLHIESASRDICGHEYITDSILESLEGASTIPLLHISMETTGAVSIAIEEIGDIFCLVFHTSKNNHFFPLVLSEVFLEHLILLEVWNLDERVINLRNHEFFIGFDRFVPVSSIFREEIFDLLWDGRRECHRLFDRPETRPDSIDVVDESHIEHTINLIEDEVFYMRKIDKSALDEVDETTRSCDDNLWTVFESFALCTDIGSAKYRERADKHPS